MWSERSRVSDWRVWKIVCGKEEGGGGKREGGSGYVEREK